MNKNTTAAFGNIGNVPKFLGTFPLS